MTIAFNGMPIPSNNISRISVYDFKVVASDNYVSSSALNCQSELTIDYVETVTSACLVGDGDSPVSCDINQEINPDGENIRGWNENGDFLVIIDRGIFKFIQHFVRRVEENPEEGYFNCHMKHDVHPLLGLYILYPSEWPFLM